jgi:ABC-type multidrug transport system ATPase subunit
MKIILNGIGKKFRTEWVFRRLNYVFETGGRYAVFGHNGTGKSTLLQTIAGIHTPSEGLINYHISHREIPVAFVFRQLSLAAPYQELIEEFTTREMLRFHFSFKPYFNGWNVDKIIQLLGAKRFGDKEIRMLSSGMKQRIKLACAILCDTSLILLDEPTTNLDQDGISWFHRLIDEYGKGRTIIVCSNHRQDEYSFCNTYLSIEDYKQ